MTEKSLAAASTRINQRLPRDKLKLDMAIKLDGGHVADIYGEESFAKINTSTKQYYAIQGVEG